MACFDLNGLGLKFVSVMPDPLGLVDEYKFRNSIQQCNRGPNFFLLAQFLLIVISMDPGYFSFTIYLLFLGVLHQNLFSSESGQNIGEPSDSR